MNKIKKLMTNGKAAAALCNFAVFLWQLPQMQDVDSICISRQCLNRRNVSENTDYDGTYCGQPDKSDD